LDPSIPWHSSIPAVQAAVATAGIPGLSYAADAVAAAGQIDSQDSTLLSTFIFLAFAI